MSSTNWLTRSLDAISVGWDPQTGPRLDRLDTVTSPDVEDFASEARAVVTSPKAGA